MVLFWSWLSIFVETDENIPRVGDSVAIEEVRLLEFVNPEGSRLSR